LKIQILGCYAATPRSFSNPTSQVLEIGNELFLIDCAEGTQVQIRKNKVKFSKINHIFISHLHGDHFFGLVGLISTFSLLNRQNELHVYGPKGIKEVVLLQLRLADAYTSYPLFFHELTSSEPQVLLQLSTVEVRSFPLKHRIYTNGFLFQEMPKPRKLDFECASKLGVETCYFQKLKSGFDLVLDNGKIIKNEEVTLPGLPSWSYAYCSDTVYDSSIANYFQNVTVLYHESTFLESEAHLATRTLHTTASQAAHIAQLAKAKNLILGHYSTRYASIQAFKTEAEAVFPNVYLADDARLFELDDQERLKY
jgi:ribonuclease Z